MVPAYIKKYFWDIDTKKADPKTHPDYFIARILEFGDRKAFVWLKKFYGIKKIRAKLGEIKLSRKSANYWRHIFG